jgi:hypothetical protein
VLNVSLLVLVSVLVLVQVLTWVRALVRAPLDEVVVRLVVELLLMVAQ